MIYSDNLVDSTEGISPTVFIKYLKDTGWKPFQRKRKNIKVFQYERNEDFYQVTIPTEKRLRDYKEAMNKAVETVAMAENKSAEQILLHLLNPYQRPRN